MSQRNASAGNAWFGAARRSSSGEMPSPGSAVRGGRLTDSRPMAERDASVLTKQPSDTVAVHVLAGLTFVTLVGVELVAQLTHLLAVSSPGSGALRCTAEHAD